MKMTPNKNTSEHKLANGKKFQVTFAYSGNRWSFRIGSFTLITQVPGGKKNAERIAGIMRASWIRAQKIDAAARNSINAIVLKNFTRLRDYQGPFDHGFRWDKEAKAEETPVVA